MASALNRSHPLVVQYRKLLEEIDSMEFYNNPIEGRINLKDIETAFADSGLRVRELKEKPEILEGIVAKVCNKQKSMIDELVDFCKINPQLPDPSEKNFVETRPIVLDHDMTREDIIRYIEERRNDSETADLAFLAYRDIKGKDYLLAFVRAVLERNPVTIEGAKEMSLDEAYSYLGNLGADSIYSENRLAQPDEVWNFNTGDGLEKAFALLDIARNRGLESWLETEPGIARVYADGRTYEFATEKTVEIDKEDTII